jgi:hypothetical protein
MRWLCRVCGMQFPFSQRTDFHAHIGRCVERNADVVEDFRPKRPFEGDPELAQFAAAEGSVYHRRPGFRKAPR